MVTISTPAKIKTHDNTFFRVTGSFRISIPSTTLVMGSNIPTIDVTVGPAYFTTIGIKVFAKNDTKNATSAVNSHPFAVIINFKLPHIMPIINKYMEENTAQ